jgi:hypothetical protein
MPIDQVIEQALRSDAPAPELRSLALRLSSEGHGRTALIEKFEGVRQELRQSDREADEDAVMDVLDFLTGWCSPHMRLPQAMGTEKAVGTPPAESGS